MRLKLIAWDGESGAVTVGKVYTFHSPEWFKDDVNDERDKGDHREGTVWQEVDEAEEFNDSTIASTFGPLEGTEKGVKLDSGKGEFSLLLRGCANAVSKVVDVLTFGAKKYTRDGWQTVDDAERRYTDALYRHMNAIHKGEHLDPESGLSHRAHVATNAMFLLELENDKKD